MQGVYQLERQPNGEMVLRQGGIALKIRIRVDPGPNKPKEFLIMFRPAYRYISSLYPIPGHEGQLPGHEGQELCVYDKQQEQVEAKEGVPAGIPDNLGRVEQRWLKSREEVYTFDCENVAYTLNLKSGSAQIDLGIPKTEER